MNATKKFAGLILVGGVAGAVMLGVQLMGNGESTALSVALWFVLGLLVVGLLGLGGSFLRHSKDTSGEDVSADYRHAIPVAVILVLALGAAFVVRP